MIQKIDTIKLDFSFYSLVSRGPVTSETDVSLDVTLPHYDRTKIGLDLILTINDTVVHGYIDPYLLCTPHDDFREKHGGDSSFFYVISCSCGEAGCNGIWDGIYLERENGNIRWIIPKDSGYEKRTNLSLDGYLFDEAEYNEVFENALLDIQKVVEDNGWSKEVIALYSNTSLQEFLKYMKDV